MKGVNIIVFLLSLMLQYSVTEGSSPEEPSAVYVEISLRPALYRDVERKKGGTKNIVLPLQADPVTLDKKKECTILNKDKKQNNIKLSCCSGRKVKDRTGVRHRLLHKEYP